MKKYKQIWQLKVEVLSDTGRLQASSMFLTSKKKAMKHVQLGCIYTLNGDMRKLSDNLYIGTATYFKDEKPVKVTLSREYLF